MCEAGIRDAGITRVVSAAVLCILYICIYERTYVHNVCMYVCTCTDAFLEL